MAATMRDVAALAGVSVKTVSRVVNLEPHTRPEIVERVRAAIAELKWVPNGAARTLRTGRTGVVGIGVAELRRPYLAALVEALVAEADRRGMPAAVEPTHYDAARVRALLEARGRYFDGVVLVGAHPEPLAPEGALTDRPVVVVQGGPLPAGVDAATDRVDEDVAEAASLVAGHLAVMGRERPVLLGADRALRVGEEPTSASAVLRGALLAAGIGRPDVPAVQLDGVADRRAGLRAARAALERHPDGDALVCVNDEVAIGALAALAAHGVDVPGRIAVIGHDKIDDGRFSTPSLTTIDPGPSRLARAALDLLSDRLAGAAPASPRSVTLPVELVRRESTLGIGAR
jgi:DNA-binding LacI/PurR family transcriptional regulator